MSPRHGALDASLCSHSALRETAQHALRFPASGNPSIDGNWWVGCDVGMHGTRDHRADEHDADEEAAQDRSGYKKIDGSHDALRLMTRTVTVAKLTMPSSRSAHCDAIAVDKIRAPHDRDRVLVTRCRTAPSEWSERSVVENLNGNQRKRSFTGASGNGRASTCVTQLRRTTMEPLL